jgi:hypothetical protein
MKWWLARESQERPFSKKCLVVAVPMFAFDLWDALEIDFISSYGIVGNDVDRNHNRWVDFPQENPLPPDIEELQ